MNRKEQAFDLVRIQGKTIAEAAKIMATTPQTIRNYIWNIENPEKRKAQTRRWRSKYATYHRGYHQAHRERENKRRAEYYQAHKEEEKRRKKQEYRKGRKKLLEKRKQYAREHPDVLKAERLAQAIPLAQSCQICGSTENLERHHADYDKPLQVITLCHQCHMRLHKGSLENRK